MANDTLASKPTLHPIVVQMLHVLWRNPPPKLAEPHRRVQTSLFIMLMSSMGVPPSTFVKKFVPSDTLQYGDFSVLLRRDEKNPGKFLVKLSIFLDRRLSRRQSKSPFHEFENHADQRFCVLHQFLMLASLDGAFEHSLEDTKDLIRTGRHTSLLLGYKDGMSHLPVFRSRKSPNKPLSSTRVDNDLVLLAEASGITAPPSAWCLKRWHWNQREQTLSRFGFLALTWTLQHAAIITDHS